MAQGRGSISVCSPTVIARVSAASIPAGGRSRGTMHRHTMGSVLTDASTRLLAEAEAMTSDQPTQPLFEATGAFLDALPTAAWIVPASILDALRTLPPIGAAWIAITLGSAVERGLPPKASATAVVGLMRRWLDSMQPDEDGDRALPAAVVGPFRWLGQSVVAHLAREPDLRGRLAADADLLERLVRASEQTPGAQWVHELLMRRSGELVVLHVETRKGLLLRYENVGRVFQLFTLVQGAIGTRLPGGREPDEELVDAAMGEGYTSHADSAWWHYQDYTATERHFMSSLWAEWSVSDIPKLDGVCVLVLWPPILGGRHWGSDFFGPALEAAPARVILERELDAAEAAAWFARLGIAAGPAV
jgi:hypothetical protein